MRANSRTVLRSTLVASLAVLALLALTIPALGATVPFSANQPLVPTDVAAAAGVAQTTPTWSAPVGDVNNDGLPDFFLSRHLGDSGELFANDGDGTFTQINMGNFPQYDRLGCVFGDVNQDDLQDLYCSIGDNKSTSQNPKELWIQQPDHTFVNEAAAYGVTDPLGRERWPTFIDVNHDGYPDLFVSVLYPRTDGLPESNHLYINQGGTSYVDAPEYGLDTTSGSAGGGGCAQAADFNNDGWQDLLLCAQDEMHLYENEGGTAFTDVTAQVGLGTGVWTDAKLVDLNGDGNLDIVEIKKGLAQVRFQQNGVFGPAVKLASLTAGFSLATGDVNGDGYPDVYLVQGCVKNTTTNQPDLMFLNNGNGTFSQIDVPEATSGCGDVASTIDYNGDGKADFLVLNGYNTPGPIQLLTFSSADTTPPTIDRSALAQNGGGPPGLIRQGAAYAVYANVSDGSGSGVASVSADLSSLTSGATSVGLTPCSSGCAVSGITYAYRSAPQTANVATVSGNASYTIRASDQAGNVSTASFPVTVDDTPPVGTDVQGTNGGSSGKIDAGDTLSVSFSEAMNPGSLLAGWTGAPASVTVSLADNAGSTHDDTLAVNGVKFGTVDLGSDKWIQPGGVTLSGTMSLSSDGSVVSITIGACTEACGHIKPGVRTTTLTWTPSTAATDLVGNPASSSPATESGAPKQNF